jgi:hypothetical protein
VSEVDKFIDSRLKKVSKALQSFSAVMPGLVPGIHDFLRRGDIDVDSGLPEVRTN